MFEQFFQSNLPVMCVMVYLRSHYNLCHPGARQERPRIAVFGRVVVGFVPRSSASDVFV